MVTKDVFCFVLGLCYRGHMESTLRLPTLAAVMLVSPAFAQTDMTCNKTDSYTTVCEFSDGRANVSTSMGDYYSSRWYTPAQWKAQKAKDARATAAKAKEHEAWQRQNDNGEKEAKSWKTQEGCENDGFIWVDFGANKGCHYSDAAKRIHKEKQQAAKKQQGAK